MPATGTVKQYFADKGFGFIKPDHGGKDLFVHASVLKLAGIEALNKGDRVEFEVEANPNGKGPRAIDVQLA